MGGGFIKAEYIDLLSLQYLVFKQVQQSGVMSLETNFEDPAKSPIGDTRWHSKDTSTASAKAPPRPS